MYRDILVHLKSHEDWSGHIEAAFALAKRSNAFLTGLITHQELALAKQLAMGPGGADLLGELQVSADAKTKIMRARFEAALAERGVRGAFEAAEGRANELISLIGRFHDLVVIEQTDPTTDELNWETTEEAAVHGGRPTLIIPRAGQFDRPFSRILLAWNGSRESTRALHAALPLIEAADAVVVLEGRGREHFGSITRMPAADISHYLSRHAKTVERAGDGVTDPEAGAAILDVAAARGCDLIVMGAFGRTGLARMVFGSATDAVFKASKLPILAAH
jgi:nucleotide-binding universal stress UspA family protein